MAMNLEEQTKLYLFLQHGDLEHQRWLMEAIAAFFAGAPRPEPRPNPETDDGR
jgi:hypothetical protein